MSLILNLQISNSFSLFSVIASLSRSNRSQQKKTFKVASMFFFCENISIQVVYTIQSILKPGLLCVGNRPIWRYLKYIFFFYNLQNFSFCVPQKNIVWMWNGMRRGWHGLCLLEWTVPLSWSQVSDHRMRFIRSVHIVVGSKDISEYCPTETKHGNYTLCVLKLSN